ncbi:unnamed protein product (macronuclear) [Paramecium tetraurelia]|uniref:Tubby C-terminal domain-containing protein n=1 Tax=Paramecium tetraurelia TaxID=5888 RepID=A0CDL9_PARTE|nr:uncharacterized protein GSPATT00007097001 [Paramecium tetraurelia]CAK68886.1 unnamed protein product [Paramecium tetraurelia]|eukprot:XP_001436283.1 hypothetical protein (macronuclear) [Paramecium tetraurelia strain d4-2]
MNKSNIHLSQSKSNIVLPCRKSFQKQLLPQEEDSISKIESFESESPLKETNKEQGDFADSDKVQLSIQHEIFSNEKQSKQNHNLCKGFVYPNPFKELRIPFDKIQFILSPIQREGILQCQIRKVVTQSPKENAKYELIMFDLPILIAEKVHTLFKKKIIIKQSGLNYFAGKLKWDKYGQNFIFMDNKLSPKKCSSISMHRLCTGGANYQKTGKQKPHKIRVYLPEIDQKKCKYFDKKPKFFQEFQNREPEYSNEAKSFVLPFYNRALIASSKNLQLCQQDKNQVFFLLGKIEKGLYNLDFQWPIFPLQAFQIAMSCFVTRASD